MNNVYAIDAKVYDSVLPCNRGKTISVTDMFPAAARKVVGNRRIHDANFAFLTTTLSKLHTTIYEPLTHVTFNEDVDVDAGGGFVDYVTYYEVDYAGIMNEYRNVLGNSTNYIPRINAGLSQKHVPVYTWGVAYDLRFWDLEKMKKVDLAKSIQEIYQNAIMAGWDIFAQHIAYEGDGQTGFGLFNNPNVSVATIDNSATIGKGFEGLTDAAVVAFFNGVFEYYLDGSNMDFRVIPDTFLVPTFVGKNLSGRFSALYTSTLREFLKKHNLAVDEASEKIPEIRIASRPGLNALGAAGKGRIVAYRKAKNFVRLDMPYPLQMYITLPNIEKAAYTTMFVGQISAIQMPYNSDSASLGVVSYWDFTN